jgi:hypothetical protein
MSFHLSGSQYDGRVGLEARQRIVTAPAWCRTKKLEPTFSAGKAAYRQLFHHFPKTIFQFVPQRIWSFHHKSLPLSHFPTKSQNENRSHRGNDKFWRRCSNPSMNDNIPSTGQTRPGKNPPLRAEEGSPAISRPDPSGTFAVPSPGRGRSAAKDCGGLVKTVSASQSSLIKVNQVIL